MYETTSRFPFVSMTTVTVIKLHNNLHLENSNIYLISGICMFNKYTGKTQLLICNKPWNSSFSLYKILFKECLCLIGLYVKQIQLPPEYE